MSHSNYNDWNIGDICYRKNEKCVIKMIDFKTKPPSLTVSVFTEPNREINTEFDLISKSVKSQSTMTPKTNTIRKMIHELSKPHTNHNLKPNHEASLQPHIPITGHKRRRIGTNTSLNPKPSKRAKTPQLIHDYGDEDDEYKDGEKHIQTAINHHGFQFASPNRHRRSDKEEMDTDSVDTDDHKCKRRLFHAPQRILAPRSTEHNQSNRHRTGSVRRRLNAQLAEYELLEEVLQSKYDRISMDKLQEISEYKASLLNGIDVLNGVSDGKRWYPMMHYSPSTKRYRPDVHRFCGAEYEVYRQKLNAHILRDEMGESEKMRVLFCDTNDKMWRHLLHQCQDIARNVPRDGVFFHQGKYHQDGSIWGFESDKQRGKYGESMKDILDWFNSHTNKTFNDNKFGTILLKRRGNAYVPQFKRVTMQEYKEYKSAFAEEMKQYCHQKNRVVKIKFTQSDADNSVIEGINPILNDGGGTAFANFSTPM
eukprot:321682_1